MLIPANEGTWTSRSCVVVDFGDGRGNSHCNMAKCIQSNKRGEGTGGDGDVKQRKEGPVMKREDMR